MTTRPLRKDKFNLINVSSTGKLKRPSSIMKMAGNFTAKTNQMKKNQKKKKNPRKRRNPEMARRKKRKSQRKRKNPSSLKTVGSKKVCLRTKNLNKTWKHQKKILMRWQSINYTSLKESLWVWSAKSEAENLLFYQQFSEKLTKSKVQWTGEVESPISHKFPGWKVPPSRRISYLRVSSMKKDMNTS